MLEQLSEEELVARIVGSVPDAKRLLEACGGAARMVRLNAQDMGRCVDKYNRSHKPTEQIRHLKGRDFERVEAAVELACRSFWGAPQTDLPEVINDHEDADKWFMRELRLGANRETFWVLPLDSAHRPICRPVVVAKGVLNGVCAGAREVFAEAVRMQAAAIVVAHNHPGGDCTPSRKDHALTKELVDASCILHIPLLDHIIISDTGSTSMLETGSPAFRTLREGAKKGRGGRRLKKGNARRRAGRRIMKCI